MNKRESMYKNLSGINQPKRVDIFDEETGGYLISFSSMRACARAVNIKPTTLWKAIQGKYPINGKYYKYGK